MKNDETKSLEETVSVILQRFTTSRRRSVSPEEIAEVVISHAFRRVGDGAFRFPEGIKPVMKKHISS